MFFASRPGSSAWTTTSLSFSKISTEGFHAVVDTGASKYLPGKFPKRSVKVLKSRKGSHLMRATIPPFEVSYQASANMLAFSIPAEARTKAVENTMHLPQQKIIVARKKARLSDSL